MKKVWLIVLVAVFDMSNIYADEINLQSVKSCYGCHKVHFTGKAISVASQWR